jgi:hypothetical protein
MQIHTKRKQWQGHAAATAAAYAKGILLEINPNGIAHIPAVAEI